MIRNNKFAWLSCVALIIAAVGTFVTPGAAATFVNPCPAIDDYAGWDFTIGKSTVAGIVIKDVRYNNNYRIEWANVPWINLDSDSTLIRMESTDVVSCVVTPHITWGEAVIRFQTTASSGNDGYGDQVIELTIQYFNSASAKFFLKTNAGSGYQEHPIYWNVAPCSACNSADGADDALVIDASNGGGVTNAAEQHGETQWDEMPHKYWIYFVYDEACAPTYCVFDLQMQFIAETFENGGTSFYSRAWALQCTACGDSQNSQYTNGPWDYLNNQNTWDVDVQLVIISYRNVEPNGGWTSYHSLISE